MSNDNSACWNGVFPAVTTQFKGSGEIDFEATQKVIDGLIADGVHGLVLMGTVGENNSLHVQEKIQVIEAALEVINGRVFTLSGVSEYDAPRAVTYIRAAQKAGIHGLMALPAMVYMPNELELDQHFRMLAGASDLPLMIYNNPDAYRLNISIEAIKRLMDVDNIVALKESSSDTRRFTDIYNEVGDRLVLFAGLDDVALEGLVLGARGWVSGLSNVFPKESVALFELVQRGELTKALEIYRWFMPLLHLDAQTDLVQCIKLAEKIMGRGAEEVRLPRMTLSGDARSKVVETMTQACRTRPDIDQLLAV